MAVTDQQVYPGVVRCPDPTGAIFGRDRHRFFDQHVLSGPGSDLRVFGVKLVRGGDVYRIDCGLRAHVLDGVAGVASKSASKRLRASGQVSTAATTSSLGCSDNVGAQHNCKSSPEPDNPQFKLRFSHRHVQKFPSIPLDSVIQ